MVEVVTGCKRRCNSDKTRVGKTHVRNTHWTKILAHCLQIASDAVLCPSSRNIEDRFSIIGLGFIGLECQINNFACDITDYIIIFSVLL